MAKGVRTKNVKSVRSANNRGLTRFLIFVIAMNWLLVAFMVFFGTMYLPGTDFGFLSVLLFGSAILKAKLTIGLMRFDNQARIIDAILSLVLFVILTPFFSILNRILLFIQFSILMFHKSTVRIFQKEHGSIDRSGEKQFHLKGSNLKPYDKFYPKRKTDLSISWNSRINLAIIAFAYYLSRFIGFPVSNFLIIAVYSIILLSLIPRLYSNEVFNNFFLIVYYIGLIIIIFGLFIVFLFILLLSTGKLPTP